MQAVVEGPEQPEAVPQAVEGYRPEQPPQGVGHRQLELIEGRGPLGRSLEDEEVSDPLDDRRHELHRAGAVADNGTRLPVRSRPGPARRVRPLAREVVEPGDVGHDGPPNTPTARLAARPAASRRAVRVRTSTSQACAVLDVPGRDDLGAAGGRAGGCRSRSPPSRSTRAACRGARSRPASRSRRRTRSSRGGSACRRRSPDTGCATTCRRRRRPSRRSCSRSRPGELDRHGHAGRTGADDHRLVPRRR